MAVKTIVVLGAGMAATLIIRQAMRTIVLDSSEYKLVVVSPTDHFQWPIAMPRAIVPGQIPVEKVVHPLAPAFKGYPANKFEFVLGKATSLDPESNLVTVALNNSGETQSITYHTLIIATGSRAKDDMPWKSLETTEKTKARIQSLQDQIKRAKTIVVAGGGVTGVETAGELGFEYSKRGKKEVYLVHDHALPLYDPLMESVRKQAKVELTKLKVQLISNATVVSSTTAPGSDDTVLQLRLSDGTTKSLTTQAYIPTIGLIPNTEFVPAGLLDAKGYVKQDKFLNVGGYSNVFVVGDVGNLEVSKAQTAEAQAVHLFSKTLPAHLADTLLPEYQPATKEMYGITVGRSRATGQMGTMKMLSFLIWFFKGRTMGVDTVPTWAAGKKTMSQTLEK